MTKFKKIKKTLQRYESTIISCLTFMTFAFCLTAMSVASVDDAFKEPEFKAGVENYISSRGETLKTYGLIEPLSTKM
ncbi:MAG: hypothetical protein II653_07300, partial [Lachnospiraceae bacterium]|nr:hypothetical protein [Lachnospiraceae bacterium]